MVTAAVVLFLVMVVATAALVVVMMVVMMVMMLVLHLSQGLSDGILPFHSLPQLLTGQLIPGGGYHRGVVVVFSQQRNGGIQLDLRNGIGSGQDDGRGGLHLVVVELTKVLHIDLDLAGIHDGNGVAQLHFVIGHLLHSGNNVGQLTHAGRLDDDPIGVIFLDDLGQRLTKIANQRAADAAGVHFGDIDAGILQKAAVNTDLTELIFDQHQLFALVGFLDHLFDKGSLTCTQETGVNIDFHKNTFCIRFFIYYTTADKA